MKILINGLLLNDKFSGVQYSTENLLQALSNINDKPHQIEVLLSKDYKGLLKTKGEFVINKLKVSTVNRLIRIYYENFRLTRYYFKNNFSLYHATGYILPFFSAMPTILTIHDIIALDFPEYCQNVNAVYFKLALPRSIRKANKIIAVSYKVKEDIIRRFDIDPQKIEVVYHGVENHFKKIHSFSILQKVIAKYNLPEKYILFVGNLEPKKNLTRLIQAFASLKKHSKISHKLVIVGKNGWKYNSIYRTVGIEKIKEDIVFTGYVDKEDLPSIYSLSDLFVFPSLYEGFGLPILEAMSCGTPVLISDRGALPEICGKIYPQVNPLDINDIEAKIYLLLTDSELRRKNIVYGLERAKIFSWDKAARETLKVYADLIKH